MQKGKAFGWWGLGLVVGILLMNTLWWWPHDCHAYFERHPEAPFCKLVVAP